MRLAAFILANVEPILAEWEVFARSIWPGAATDPATLRDHAEAILLATASDMMSAQTATQRSDKSKGEGHAGEDSDRVNAASQMHGSDRVDSGFDLGEVVAEYRALRASVLRLWRESAPPPDPRDLDELTRFNESIDQSLSKAVEGYAKRVEHDRAQLTNEQLARTGAETANRAKDIFLATLGHELRTPLNAILGWASILTGGCTREDLTEGIEVIRRNALAQAKLIDDVLDVSRIISGKLRLDITQCDLTAAINAALDSVRSAADAKGIALHAALDPSACATSCDAIRIQQVVWNLLSNAIKFTQQGGRVSVTLSRDRSTTRIAVRDNGQGISEEFLPYVFERFRQADGSTRRKFSGLGLGLSIVKHIVELHGGSVRAESAGEGRGSTFTVLLPVRAVNVPQEDRDVDSASEPGKPDVTPAAPVRLDGLRVLVVDDEADARRLIAKVLEDVGATVTVASGAREALESLRTNTPQVLISDIGMPEMDGFDLIRAVRSQGNTPRDLPAVALTAFAQKEDQRRALLAGFQVHVPKPVDPYDLLTVVASLAGRTGTS
jgi:signal transduction histidine kinase/ActR/RegA family two-component response regulator